MKKVVKTVVLLVIFLCCAALVFGGGKQEKGTGVEKAEEAGPFAVTLSEDPMTIYVWTISGVITTEWKLIEEMYETENPNIDLVVNSIDPPDAIREAAGPAVAMGQEDLDILWYWGGGRPFEWFRAGLVHDMKPYFDHYNWEEQLLSGYEPYAFTPEGDAMPWFCTNWVSFPFLYYNKSIFAEAGVSESFLATLDDFFAAGKKIRSAGYDPMAVTGVNPNYPSWTSSAIAARLMGPEKYKELRSWPLLQNKTKESAEIYRSDEMVEAFETVVRMADELFPKNFEGYDDTAANEAFLNERAAMHLGGSWWIGTFKDVNAARLHLPPVEAGGYAPTFSFFANGVTVPSYVDDQKLDRISDIFNKILSGEYARELFESGAVWSSSANVAQEDISDLMDPMYFQTLKMIEQYGTETVAHFLMSADRMDTYLSLTGEALLHNISPEQAAEELYESALDKLSD